MQFKSTPAEILSSGRTAGRIRELRRRNIGAEERDLHQHVVQGRLPSAAGRFPHFRRRLERQQRQAPKTVDISTDIRSDFHRFPDHYQHLLLVVVSGRGRSIGGYHTQPDRRTNVHDTGRQLLHNRHHHKGEQNL